LGCFFSIQALSCCPPSSSLIIESQTELALADLQHGMLLPYPSRLSCIILIEGAELAVLGFCCSCRQKNPKNPKFHCGDNIVLDYFVKYKFEKQRNP
jgi:hypothetical protein